MEVTAHYLADESMLAVTVDDNGPGVAPEQMDRLFRNNLYSHIPSSLDSFGRIRLDDLEMRADVQREVTRLWNRINTENLERLSDINGFRDEFLIHHGFGMKEVDYTEEVEV